MRLDTGWTFAVCEPDVATSPREAAARLSFAPAHAPGTAASALIAEGRWSWDDPPPLDQRDVWYATRVEGYGSYDLIFEGLATIADVYLDDALVLRSDNMFVAHAIDVELRGAHRLTLRFRALTSALAGRKGRARWRPRMIQPSEMRFARTSALGHMPGFAPPAPPVGPWRAIRLVSRATPDIVSSRVAARVDGAGGVVDVELELSRAPARVPEIECESARAQLTAVSTTRFVGALRLPSVARWFPHTHGDPRLYLVNALIEGESIAMARVGFRTIEVDRGDDGGGFALRVNGVDVFCRGAVWTPLDPIDLQNEASQLANSIALARAAGVNMLRIGATGVYETDDFYGACDNAGILVWQDFMFSNFDYPVGDPAFVASVETETRQFLRRTNFAPSMAVLCGGNEAYQQAAMMGVAEANWRSPLFEDALPRYCAEERPDVAYVVNSPSGGALPFHADAGVAHYYGVGAYRRPLDDARRAGVRFASECLGFANVPDTRTLVEDFGATPLASRLWTARIPRDQGASQDFEQVRDHYVGLLYDVDPDDLKSREPDRYLDLSRAAVAEVIEATIGEWRRPGSPCAGALVWFWKDLWASSGWGVLDWRGRPKSPWHALRRACRPLQVLVSDEGVNGLHVHCINEGPTSFSGRLSLRCYRDGATIVMDTTREIALAPRASCTLRDCEIWGAFFDTGYAYRFGPPSHEATVATLYDDADRAVSEAWSFPIGRSAAMFAPNLVAEIVHDELGSALRITTDRLAQSVKIEDATLDPEDNWFHLAPGASRLVRFGDRNIAPRGRIAALGAPPVSYGAN